MRFIPQSLGGRLLAGAALFIAVALIVSAVAIGFILERFVHAQIDQRLDGQIESVAAALTVDAQGRLATRGLADGPPFDRPLSGWYWQAEWNGQVIGSVSLAGTSLDLIGTGRPAPPRPLSAKGPRAVAPDDQSSALPARVDGPRRDPLVARMRQTALANGTVTILTAAPRDAIDRPLRDALVPLIVSLAILGAALMGALFLQVRFGLRPLKRLEQALAMVGDGRIDRVPEGQPTEVSGLVYQMNALLDQNEKGLERARRHLANLAHGLKTPLATLAVTAQEDYPAARPRLAALVAGMDRLIRHHLARARTAALDGPVRARTALAGRLADIGAAMEAIHRPKPVQFTLRIPADLKVACEAQDLDELFGNLLDNAFRFATGKVDVTARIASGMIVAVIEDDGPGLPDGQAPAAMQPGFRFDESQSGYGFGLPIAVEIAQLYGGNLAMGRAALGGLQVSVTLPVAAGPA